MRIIDKNMFLTKLLFENYGSQKVFETFVKKTNHLTFI